VAEKVSHQVCVITPSNALTLLVWQQAAGRGHTVACAAGPVKTYVH